MTDTELQHQFTLCEKWNDADQWDALAHAYFARGYYLTSAACFRRADELRGVPFAEAMLVEQA